MSIKECLIGLTFYYKIYDLRRLFSMTKLEWCRSNAPEALRNLSDDEVLELMESSFQQFGKDFVDDDESYESVEYNAINSDMDYMVITLVRTFGDKLAFKGGYMLTKLIPDTARQTTDVDFSIQSSDLYAELIDTMHVIGKHLCQKGSISNYTVKEEIRPYMSGGMDMYDADGRKVLGIDVGWHDITFGTTTTTIDVCELRAFEVERMLADKVTAILSRKRFRRPKDIYDLYCITNCLDFNANKVNEYIMLRTEGQGADWRNFPFTEDVIREYEKAYNKLSLNSIRAGVTLDRPDFSDVLERFSVICRRLLNVESKPLWNAQRGWFESE